MVQVTVGIMTIRHIIMTLNHYMVVKSQQLLRTISFRHLLLLPRRESSFYPEDAKKNGFRKYRSLFLFLKRYFDHDFKFSVVQTSHCLVISSCFTSYMIQSCLSSVDLWQDSILGHTEESRTPFRQNIPSQVLRAVPSDIIQELLLNKIQSLQRDKSAYTTRCFLCQEKVVLFLRHICNCYTSSRQFDCWP